MSKGDGQRGFTLPEIQASMAIIIILSGSALVFAPLWPRTHEAAEGDMAARQLNVATERLKKDLKGAAVDSMRTTTSGTKTFIEFAPVTGSGAAQSAGVSSAELPFCPSDDTSLPNDWDNDRLSASKSDSCFKTSGLGSTDGVTAGNFVLIPGSGSADFYGTASARSTITSVTRGARESRIVYTAKILPAPSGMEIQMVSQSPVSWICDTSTGTLVRRTGYPLSATQPTTFASGTAETLTLGISGCTFSVGTRGVAGKISVTRSGNSVEGAFVARAYKGASQ